MADFYRQLPRVAAALDTTNVTISGPITVSNEVEIKNDIGNPIPIDAVNLDVRDLQFSQDKVDVSGSSVLVDTRRVKNYYAEITGVPSGVTVPIITKSVSVNSVLKYSDFSGNNMAQFELVLNGFVIDKKRTSLTLFNSEFKFENGLSLSVGDVLTVRVSHNRLSVGEFSCKFLIEE